METIAFLVGFFAPLLGVIVVSRIMGHFEERRAGADPNTDKHQSFDPVEEITVTYAFFQPVLEPEMYRYAYIVHSESGEWHWSGHGGNHKTHRKALRMAKKGARQSIENHAKTLRDEAERAALRQNPITETIRVKV